MAVKLLPLVYVLVAIAVDIMVIVGNDGPPEAGGSVLLTAPRRTSYDVDPEVITGVVSDVPWRIIRVDPAFDQYGVAPGNPDDAPSVTGDGPQETPLVAVGNAVIGQLEGGVLVMRIV